MGLLNRQAPFSFIKMKAKEKRVEWVFLVSLPHMIIPDTVPPCVRSYSLGFRPVCPGGQGTAA